MANTAEAASILLASGPDWRVRDIICTAGPGDRPFEERHGSVCIAMVTHGTFQYRSALGAAVLAPGALLLGNEGVCFECGHEHAPGDRCLSFQFAPRCFEAIVAETPGVRRANFPVVHLPALPSFVRLIAEAEAARDDRDAEALEELALRLAGAVAVTLSGSMASARAPSRGDERRITRALRRIEADAENRVTLAALSREAGMSRYHFLRVFRQVSGMAPHQYVLRTRLNRAAVALRRSDAPISSVAFDAGFGDLSTFNRRFRRFMGESPSVYRAKAGRPYTR